jgi:hypothetical protein
MKDLNDGDMARLIQNIPDEVTKAIADSLQLLQHACIQSQTDYQNDASQPLPSLLERCEKHIHKESRAEPVRLIHHLACTGGTLITKCLACSPNIQVLNELDPLSSKTSAAGLFNPTDLIQLLEHGNRSASLEDKLAIFMMGFKALFESSHVKGLRILIRDHTHSHFCAGDTLPERPTLGQIFAGHFKTLSIITVRHPLDSWLSMANNGWVEFSPGTLEEYARRYLVFLDAYSGTRVFKYEDFVDNPDDALSDICRELALPVPPQYQDLFMAHRFSGDSGRSGNVIRHRERRPIDEDLLTNARESSSFLELCDKLEYTL